MSDLVNSVEDVKESGEEIQAINNLINEISYQTNILSLNAMIEASRSGDDGGGFKVVALEVKKLAERSAKAAADINTLLEKNAKSIGKGVDLSNTMQQRYQVITEEIKPLALSIKQVSDSSFEQTRAIRQISDGLQDIDKSAQESRSLAIETSQMAADLQSNSQQLLSAMNALKE
jgi:methyl-accepting chemotaxis protein